MNEFSDYQDPLPKLIADCFNTIFNFPEKKLCAQVATQSDSTPTIRTMKLVDITEDGELIFLSNTQTQKWQDLNQSPKMATLIYDPILGVQVIARGTVILETKLTNENKVDHYWGIVRPSVKKLFYTEPHLPIDLKAPLHFGVMRLLPEYWEILTLNLKEYDLSTRICFTKIAGEWQKKECPVNS